MREKNKIAILGGGLTGLTAAYYLAKKNYEVTVIEKEKILGGLASGFKKENWSWYLERTVHHLFSNDNDILGLAKEIGFNSIFLKSPETASLYQKSNIKDQKFSIFPLNTPLDLLKFPLLSFFDRIRAGLVMGFIKFSPFFSFYEKLTAQEFLEKTMGKKAHEILFGELFRKKFGQYAGNILASFIWARVKKRTKNLGYIVGGFQSFINYLEKKLTGERVKILKNYEIKQITKENDQYIINGEVFEVIISTLPTPVLIQTAKNVFTKEFIDRLSQIKFLHAISLIIESEKPIFSKTYWMNIAVPEIPIMGLFQQTNFIDKKNYGGKNILYCGWYVGENDKLWSMSEDEIINYVLPYLNKISNFQFLLRQAQDPEQSRGTISKQTSNFQQQISNFHVFKAPFAQPIFDQEFLKNKPEFITPEKNFFIANLDMTYPYDRGTNYAVKLGKEVAKLI